VIAKLVEQLRELKDNDARALELAVQLWNECVPVGSRVSYDRWGAWHAQDWSVTRGPAFVCNGLPVVRIKGIMGPVRLDRVEPRDYDSREAMETKRVDFDL
jgi:hypothetical protein